MDLEKAIGLINTWVAEMEEEERQARNLFQFHAARAALSTYRALLTFLEPVRDYIGPEVCLQRTYLRGVAQACQRVAELLHQVEEG